MTGELPTNRGLGLLPLLRRTGRDIESEIQGRSMGISLPPGTRILIRCREDGTYPDGCVIAFVAGRGLVGHRVVGQVPTDREGQSLLLTRGDGTIVPDAPVESDRVLGEVTEWHDGKGWRPVPPPPTDTAIRRLGATGLLFFIRSVLAVDRGLAGRLARLMTRVAQRLSPSEPVASPGGSSGAWRF